MNKSIMMVTLFVLGIFIPQIGSAFELIKVDGSSTVFPITEAVSEEFQKTSSGIKVMVGISGTGGGFKRFCRGETDISDASRPIKSSEVQLCRENGIEYIELPVAYDGLAVVVNPKNNWVDHLTVRELKTMWQSEAQRVTTQWNQIRSEFPDRELHLFGPGTDSGTFDYFTEVINGKSGNSRGDYTASEDDNVLVEGVASDPNALAYFGLAYYEQNKERLKLVAIDDGNDTNGQGPILPSLKTVRDSTYQPLARPIFIYVSTKAAKKESVRKFIEYYLENTVALSEEVGYIPLPEDTLQEARERFQRGQTGSMFGKRR